MRSIGLVAIATALFGALFAPREHVPAWLVLVAVSSVSLFFAARAARGTSIVLGGAAVLRIAALFAPVSLSDDVHRYVWDGAIVVEGGDPYEHRPRELGG